MRKGIQETDKSFVFYRLIEKNPVKVSLRCGWIWIEETKLTGNPFKPRKKVLETYTTEDARNLIAAIQKLIPDEESDGPSRSVDE